MPQGASSEPIRFLLNDRLIEVTAVKPDMTLLSYLRTRAGLVGTKEGCNEGDCGACTVVIGKLNKGELQMSAVNACVRFLPTLDGTAVYTVESLRQERGTLHPIQASMVACHASQCGFCTPGFVMSLWGLYVNRETGNKPDAEAIRQSISGNLCRCTGYRSIVEAGQRAFGLPRAAFDRERVTRVLRSLVRTGSFAYEFQGRHFYAPHTLSEMLTIRKALPSATILAGGTDLGVWANKQFRRLGDIIYAGEVNELNTIDEADGRVTIGAGVSLSAASRVLQVHYPQMRELWERFGSMPVRNAGTLGGNIANGSPIGDAMPALIALGTEVTLCSATHSRRLPLEQLYVGYQQKALQADEILAFVHVPLPNPGIRFRAYKLAKRYDVDISAVCAAFAIELEGNAVSRCRIAFGGMAPIPARASRTERFLQAKEWEETTVQSAMDILSQDFQPITDMRASASYRVKAARNLLYRFFLETRSANAMSTDFVSVFASSTR